MDNNTRTYYEKHADKWTAEKVNSFHHEKQFSTFLKLARKNALVLDIGCSWGIHVPLFLGMGHSLRYEGMDASVAFLKIARRRFPLHHFFRGDISKPSSLRKKYAGFWAAAVLMHLKPKDIDRTLATIEQHATKGAVMYVTLPTERPNLATGVDRREFTILTPREQRALFTSRGWNIVQHGVIDGTTKKKIWHWYLLRLP